GWGAGVATAAPPPVTATVAPPPTVAVVPPATASAPEGDAVPPPAEAEGAAAPPSPTVAAASVDDGLVVPEPPAHGSPEALLRALLDQRRADVHRCAGVGVIPVRVSWTEAGVVSLALDPPLSGTA